MFPAGFALGKHLVIYTSREIYSNVSLKIMQQLYNVFAIRFPMFVTLCTSTELVSHNFMIVVFPVFSIMVYLAETLILMAHSTTTTFLLGIMIH